MEQQTYTLTLPYCVSSNRYWETNLVRVKDPKKLAAMPHLKRTGGWMAVTHRTRAADEYIEHVHYAAARAGILTPIAGRVKVEYLLYPHQPKDWATRMRRLGEHWDDSVGCIDLGNANKVLEDALKGIVYVDDKWTWRLFGYRMPPDEHGERVVVRVTKMAPPAPTEPKAVQQALL